MNAPAAEVSPQKLLEAGLGWPLYHDGRQIENLAELDGERAHIALAGLTIITEARNQALGPGAPYEAQARWVPGGTGAVVLNQVLRPERRRLQMLQGVEKDRTDYAAGRKTTELRRTQLTVVDNFHNFLIGRREPIEGLDRACSFVMPTGMGKTAVLVSIAEMLKSAEDRADPIRELVVEPDIDLLLQTVRKGFGKFGWPGMDVGVFYRSKKQGDREIVAMTDESFNIQFEHGTLGDFDAVLGNEAHMLLGAKTLANLREYCANRLLVLTTATPDRSETRSVRNVARSIFDMSLREALEATDDERWVAPLQCMTVKAPVNQEIIDYVKRRLKNLSVPKELFKRFVQREASMRTSLRFAEAMVTDGIQTLIKCAPGDNMAEAYEMAQRLNAIDIIDPRTGVQRKIIAEVISGTMTPEERQEVYDRFNEGEVDVMTFCRVLIMGWDSPRAKGMIDNYPNSSLTDSGQSLGRLSRIFINEDGKEVVGLAVTVVNDLTPPGFVSYAQFLGETVNDPDKIIGIQEEGAVAPLPQSPASGERRGIHRVNLPDDLRQLVNEVGNISLQDISDGYLSEQNSLNAAEAMDERANRITTVDRAAAILKIDRSELAGLIAKHHIPLKQSRKTQVLYVRQGDLATIITNETRFDFQPLPDQGYQAVAELAELLGLKLAELEATIKARKMPVITFVDHNNVPDRYLSSEGVLSLRRVHQANVTREKRKRRKNEEF